MYIKYNVVGVLVISSSLIMDRYTLVCDCIVNMAERLELNADVATTLCLVIQKGLKGLSQCRFRKTNNTHNHNLIRGPKGLSQCGSR